MVNLHAAAGNAHAAANCAAYLDTYSDNVDADPHRASLADMDSHCHQRSYIKTDQGMLQDLYHRQSMWG